MSASELLDVAEEAARAAGAVLLDHLGRDLRVDTKTSATDPVSEADHAAEEAIRAVLAARRPEDGILGEEGDDVAGSSGLRWIVDPLDGTVNYLYGHPQWCVSVACEGRAGVIWDPLREELFAVDVDSGERRGVPLAGSRAEDLGHVLLGTGFAYDSAVRTEQAPVVAGLLPRVRDLRRAGSAALDLAWAAAGRIDAFYEHGVKPWDVAAGRLLCEAAGLQVADLPARGARPEGILVAPPGPVFDALLEAVA